jgi:predicted tellurium resistance membrane protein TerC
MEWITDPSIWISLVTLTLLEIVLGIDNVIFISILAGKLPKESQDKARQVGLGLALITRILLLCGLSWLVSLTEPLFTLFENVASGKFKQAFSGRDLILLIGGLFLLAKSTHEIHEKLEGEDGSTSNRVAANFWSVIVQILLIDIVFSLDSVITAVGMVDQLGVMIGAVIIAVGFMLIFSKWISDFVNQHPTIKMLALSFLILIGVMLIADGLGRHIPKGYIYFAMAFSVGVECLNIRMRAKRTSKIVEFKQPYR